MHFLLQHWLAVHTGSQTVPHGPWYNFWSGFGGDMAFLVSWIGSAFLLLRHVNCQKPWCPRLGRHPTADGIHRLCGKHHPDVKGKKRKYQEILEAHNAAKAKLAAAAAAERP